jgi:hypothetical protein
MAKERKPEELTEEELAEANGEPLPDREVMSVIRAGGLQQLPLPVDSLEPDPSKGVIPIDDPPPSGA